MGPINLLLAQAQRNEDKFKRWYVPMAREMGMDTNPDAPEHFYNMRGLFFDSGGNAGPQRGHFPSKYKLPGHPRTYLDDTQGRIFDTRSAKYLDGTPVPPRLLRASEQSPDMPGFDPDAPRGGFLQPPFVPYGYSEPSGKAPATLQFRDPSQAGPAPPPRGYLVDMYGKGM